jgi:hypothetical protein
MEEDTDERSNMIQSRHRAEKPKHCSSSSRYSQQTESKAFAKSSLSNSAGNFFLWRARAKFLTKRKLSCRQRVLMNALCASEIRPPISGVSRRANTLENSFATEWVKLIGR